MPAPFLRLKSVDDPRVDEYRSIPDPELLRTRNLFVAEGRFVVQRVIEDGRYHVRSVLISEASRRALDPQLAALPAGTPVYTCDLESFQAITGFNLHRGCLALVERPVVARAEALLNRARRILVLEDVSNPDNVGGVFRNAAAFGADAVLLSPGCADPFYRKAIRASMAATLRVPFARLEHWPDDLRSLHAHGFVLAALTPREPARPAHTLASCVTDRFALMAGAEGPGLTEAALAIADLRVRIPIAAAVDSLNVSVAVAIALHAISPQLTEPG